MTLTGKDIHGPPIDPAQAAGRATLSVNGSVHEFRPDTTVAELVATYCSSPDGVAVARNREVVPKSSWALTTVEPGDQLEIVTAAAGG